jgi:hypothetical protein
MTRTGSHGYLRVGRELGRLGGFLGGHGDDYGAAAAAARARRQEAVGAKKILRRKKDI